MDLGQFIDQLWNLLHTFSGLSDLMKLSAVLTLLISAWKVSLFQPIWEKLGSLQSYVAPLLAVGLAMVTSLLQNGGVSLESLPVAIVIGLTSIGFHELLDALKNAPGLGSAWVSAINQIEAALGGGPNSQLKAKIAKLCKLPPKNA